MSFRKFGGLKFSSKHNAVGSHYNTTDNLLVTQAVGQPNSHINFESDISGNISVYGDLDVSGNLDVSGDTSLHYTNIDGDLDVSGDTSLHYTNIDGDLDVSGDTSLHDTTIDGSLNVTGLTVTGSTYSQYMYLTAEDYTTDPSGVVPKSYIDSVAKDLTLFAGQGLEIMDGNTIQVKDELDFLTNVTISNNLTLLDRTLNNNSKSEIYESGQDFYIDLYDNIPTLKNQLKLTYSGLSLSKGFVKLENNIGDKLIYFDNNIDKYYTELQNYVLRTGVPSIASHNFRCGTTDEVIINATDTTFNNNIVQGGTNIINQTGTGDNYLKNIVQVDTSIIYQVGTGTNTLQNTNFTGDITVLKDKLIRFYDSTNTKSSLISQYGYSMEISNESYDQTNSSQNIKFFLRGTNANDPIEKLSIGRDTTTFYNAVGIRYDRNNGSSIAFNVTDIVGGVSKGMINIYPNSVKDSYNHIVNDGDNLIFAGDGTYPGNTLALTTWSSTTCGVRIEDSRVVIGAGGYALTPSNSIVIDGTNNNIVIDSPVGVFFDTATYIRDNTLVLRSTTTNDGISKTNQTNISQYSNNGSSPNVFQIWNLTPYNESPQVIFPMYRNPSIDPSNTTVYPLIINNTGIKVTGTAPITFPDSSVQTTAFILPSQAPTGTYATPSSVVVNSAGQITSITSGTTYSLPSPQPTAGNYTNANITVNSAGQITSASNGSSGGTPTLEAVLKEGNTAGGYSIYMSAGKPIYFGGTYINLNGADLELVNYTANATISLYTASGVFARLNTSGQFQATSFNAISDYRIKENIEPLNETINVDNLKPVKYFNKQTKREDMGLVAHELQEVFPFLVNGEKDGEDYQSVNYNGLIPVLIKEIQDLKQEIKSLKNLFIKKID